MRRFESLAEYYTGTIKKAATKKGRPFVLGLTSHARGFSNYPKIPWGPFVEVSNILLPQTYWRYYDDKTRACKDENQGSPDSAVRIGYTDYGPKGKPVIPVAGEIRCATVQEIAAFGKILADKDLIDGHFYVNNSNVSPDVLQAIKALSPKSDAPASIV
ncbi:MAG: hypothetical protein E6G96_00680 [Alphaproteobacteria bacterium]|nr:MAG: hypothetical protein E6G96_00680 [Alphaproteobacteria bacterium]